MTRNQSESILADMVVGTFTARCDLCDKKESVQCFDSGEAATVFYDSGWRGNENEETLLCRKCRRRR